MAKTKTNNTDQMRRLQNTCVLAGQIAEIERFTEGKTKDSGIDYISFKGTIRCGETPVYDTKFEIFSTAMRTDPVTGKQTERPNFKKMRDWCRNCVPLTKSTEDATWVEMGGFIGMNDYVNREGKLVEGVRFSINWTRAFTEYKAEINLEAQLHSVVDETDKEGEETGRKRLRMISSDIYGNAVDLKIVKAEAKIGEQLEEAGYETGALATYFISLIPSEVKEVKPKSGGIGQQRTTMGRSFLEFMLVGADPIIEEDDEKMYIEPQVFKRLMTERKVHLNEIEEKGYQGGNSGGSPKAGGIGKANSSSKKASADENDDDDMPF